MWSAIEELQGDVSADVSQQTVVAHSQRVLSVVAAGIPPVDRSHSARVRADERRNGEHAMAINAAARRERRNHGMTQPRKHACTLAAVVQRVFLKGLRQGITCRCAYRRDGEIRSESLSITLSALFPLGRSIVCLINAGGERSADNGIRAECIKKIVAQLRFLRRTNVREIKLCWGGAGNSAGKFGRVSQRLCRG